MRILWLSNIESRSAYAQQSRLYIPRIIAAGHHVEVVAIGSTMGGRPKQIDNFRVWPAHLDPLLSDSILHYYEVLKADAVISLVDVWGLKPHVMKKTRWYPFVPVDHMPLPPRVEESLEAARRCIALSQFGKQQIEQMGKQAWVVPHAVDPSVWQPGDKREARRRLGLPEDVFLASFVGVNDSNPSRKGLPELLAAWQGFTAQRPDSRLYLHTDQHGNLPINSTTGGVDIPKIMETLRLDSNQVIFADQFKLRDGIIEQRQLAEIARASDVLVLPSRGEGFGVPLIEFQRAGCPVITTNFAAQAELCFGGWLIEGEPEWSWQQAWVYKPGVAGLNEALLEAYERRDDPDLKEKAIQGARQFEIDNVMGGYMLPVLNAIAEDALNLMVGVE